MKLAWQCLKSVVNGVIFIIGIAIYFLIRAMVAAQNALEHPGRNR